MSGQTVLVTGAAGSIGFHVAQRLPARRATPWSAGQPQRLLRSGAGRMARLLDAAGQAPAFSFVKLDLADRGECRLPAWHRFPVVIHPRRRPVRHRWTIRYAYVDANLHANVEGCRHNGCRWHLLYASSSMVYGLNAKLRRFPCTVAGRHPVSLYAANEEG